MGDMPQGLMLRSNSQTQFGSVLSLYSLPGLMARNNHLFSKSSREDRLTPSKTLRKQLFKSTLLKKAIKSKKIKYVQFLLTLPAQTSGDLPDSLQQTYTVSPFLKFMKRQSGPVKSSRASPRYINTVYKERGEKKQLSGFSFCRTY